MFAHTARAPPLVVLVLVLVLALVVQRRLGLHAVVVLGPVALVAVRVCLVVRSGMRVREPGWGDGRCSVV